MRQLRFPWPPLALVDAQPFAGGAVDGEVGGDGAERLVVAPAAVDHQPLVEGGELWVVLAGNVSCEVKRPAQQAWPGFADASAALRDAAGVLARDEAGVGTEGAGVREVARVTDAGARDASLPRDRRRGC